MHTPDVLKFKKMLTVLYLSCPFKRDFTAVSSLGNSGDILILPVYYCYSCNWCGICAGSRRRSTCENCHYVFMSIKYLNFYYTVETIVVIYSSAQQCSWFFFQHFIESWWKTTEIKYITNYVSNFSVCWETALAFSLINVLWKSPVWMVCLVKNCCGMIHTSVLYYTFKKKKKRKFTRPETNNFLHAFHHWWDWFCNTCSRDFKGVILMSKGVLFVTLAQTRFMEITCSVRYDSSPASYHVTANNCKFTTSLICTFVWLHFPMCYLHFSVLFFFLFCFVLFFHNQAMATPLTHNLVAHKNTKEPNPLLAYAYETSARI